MKKQIWLHVIDVVDVYVMLAFIDGKFMRADAYKDCITNKMYADLHDIAHDTRDSIDATIEAVEYILEYNKIHLPHVIVETGADKNNIYLCEQ